MLHDQAYCMLMVQSNDVSHILIVMYLMVLLIYRLRRTSKSTRFDKKYLIFGEKDEEGEERHLLGIIRRNLREALDGLLTSAEVLLQIWLFFFSALATHSNWFLILMYIPLVRLALTLCESLDSPLFFGGVFLFCLSLFCVLCPVLPVSLDSSLPLRFPLTFIYYLQFVLCPVSCQSVNLGWVRSSPSMPRL